MATSAGQLLIMLVTYTGDHDQQIVRIQVVFTAFIVILVDEIYTINLINIKISLQLCF